MPILQEFVGALQAGAIDVLDLTAPLSEQTPVIRLPDGHGQAWGFRRELISRYDDAGPLAYWSNFSMSEHTGTHFDAPVHWISGRELDDVSRVPPRRLVAPAAVLDCSQAVAADPDFLLRREHVDAWRAEHGALPDGGWLLLRSGWGARRGDPAAFLNGGHTPGVAPDCARHLAEETALIGIGVETVGTDAGAAARLDPQFPCHWYFQGAGKYGLTQLRGLELLPAQGALLVTGPLPIVGGSGSPARVLALVERAAGGRDGR